MASGFRQFYVRPFYGLRQVALQWEMNGTPALGKYTVFRSPNGYSSWEALGFVNGLDHFVDERSFYAGRYVDWFYQVVQELGGIFTSSPVVATMERLKRHEFGAARYIMRSEAQVMRQFGTFVLFKQLTGGTVCPQCYNEATDQDYGSTRCPVCYGTKIQGGFHAPVNIVARMITSAKYQRFDQPDGTGSKDPEDLTYRVLGFPVLAKNDLLVDTDSDRRYLISTSDNYWAFGKVPVISHLEVTQLNASDVRATLPVGEFQNIMMARTMVGWPEPVPVNQDQSLTEAAAKLSLKEFTLDRSFHMDLSN